MIFFMTIKQYFIKQELIHERGNYCEVCGDEFDNDQLELDHVKAKTFGGRDEKYNFQLKCISCHRKKTTRDIRQKGQEKRLKNYYLS